MERYADGAGQGRAGAREQATMSSTTSTPVALALAILACGGGHASATSGTPIGDAVLIVNRVTADLDKDHRTLATGDNVRQDETIEVSADGKGELKLADDTKLALGAGARLVLDKFVYDPDRKAGSIVLNLAKGAFRFVTGVAQKPTYEIRTPNASITVRGTIFDVYVLPNNTTWLLLHEGAVEVRNDKRECRVLNEPGHMLRIGTRGEVGQPINWNGLPGRAGIRFEDAFPFVVERPQLSPPVIMTADAVIARSRPRVVSQECVTPVPPGLRTQRTQRDDDPKKAQRVKRAAAPGSEPEEKPKRRRVEKPDEDRDDDSPPRKRKVVVIEDPPRHSGPTIFIPPIRIKPKGPKWPDRDRPSYPGKDKTPDRGHGPTINTGPVIRFGGSSGPKSGGMRLGGQSGGGYGTSKSLGGGFKLR